MQISRKKEASVEEQKTHEKYPESVFLEVKMIRSCLCCKTKKLNI